MVQEYLFAGPLRWDAAKSSQRQTCELSLTSSESATRDGCTWRRAGHKLHFRPMHGHYFCHAAFSRDQLNPYLQGAQARGWNNGKSGTDHNVRLLNVASR
jgi:hypothetical protein